jgi:hypothetical protein
MDKVQKYNSFNTNTPSSESYRNYQVESLDESFDINNAWKSIKENIKTSAKDNLGYHRLKHNKP